MIVVSNAGDLPLIVTGEQNGTYIVFAWVPARGRAASYTMDDALYQSFTVVARRQVRDPEPLGPALHEIAAIEQYVGAVSQKESVLERLAQIRPPLAEVVAAWPQVELTTFSTGRVGYSPRQT